MPTFFYAKNEPGNKKQITAISKTELEKIVIKMAAKDKAVFDYLLVNSLEKETD